MATNHIVWRRPQLDFMLNNPAGEVGRWMAGKGLRVLVAARAQVGVQTGALRMSLRMEHNRSTRGQFMKIGSPLSYAHLHHEGTRPHVILPVRAQLLVFVSKGTLVRTNRVNHPGTKPNRYLTDPMHMIFR